MSAGAGAPQGRPVRVGLVGYGMAGREIHAPLLLEAGLEVAVVATRDETRSAAARAELPGARVVPDLDALLAAAPDAGVDLVVLASASGAHADQALAVVEAGLPLVVDKPLATSAAAARTVVAAARAAGVPLTVFQNRRFDDEQRTLAAVLAGGALGEVFRFERRWERWRPTPKDRWRENAPPEQGGGLLLDLHTHLVDAAVQLFGPVAAVYAEVAARTTVAEDDAFLAVEHTGGVRSHLSALSLAGAPGPRTRVLGTAGAYVVTHFESEPTGFPGGEEPDGCTGWLVRSAERTPVPRAPGGHADLYRGVAAAVAAGRAGAPPEQVQALLPVQPDGPVHVLDVIEAARTSAVERRVVPVPEP